MDEASVRALIDAERDRFQHTVEAESLVMAERVAVSDLRAAVVEKEALVGRQLHEAHAAQLEASREARAARDSGSSELMELKCVVDVKLVERLEVFDGQESRLVDWVRGPHGVSSGLKE